MSVPREVTGGRRLGGQVVAVTGGGSGIGAAAATACAVEGAAVAVVDRDLAAATAVATTIGDHGGTAVPVELDVTRGDQIAPAFDAIEAALGPLSGLFNNAAVALHSDGPLTDVVDETWDLTLAINLTGAMRCMRAAVGRMVRNGGGSIVNNVSVAALVAEPNLDAYTASKGGLLALSRAVAASYADRGVRSNAICPGLVRTPMARSVGSTLVRRFERETLLPIGAPSDVASLVVYLLAEESRYVTGTAVVIDGGYTAR